MTSKNWKGWQKWSYAGPHVQQKMRTVKKYKARVVRNRAGQNCAHCAQSGEAVGTIITAIISAFLPHLPSQNVFWVTLCTKSTCKLLVFLSVKSNYTNISNVKWRKCAIYEAIPITAVGRPQKCVEAVKNFVQVWSETKIALLDSTSRKRNAKGKLDYRLRFAK